MRSWKLSYPTGGFAGCMPFPLLLRPVPQVPTWVLLVHCWSLNRVGLSWPIGCLSCVAGVCTDDLQHRRWTNDYHSRPVFYHPPGRHLDKSGKLLHSLHLQVILPSFPWYPIHPLPPCRGGTMVRPMITIIFACVCWLTVPTLFAPYPTWQNLCEVRGVMRGWIMYFKGFEGTVIDKLLFYEFWHLMMICNLLSNMKCIYNVLNIYGYTYNKYIYIYYIFPKLFHLWHWNDCQWICRPWRTLRPSITSWWDAQQIGAEPSSTAIGGEFFFQGEIFWGSFPFQCGGQDLSWCTWRCGCS